MNATNYTSVTVPDYVYSPNIVHKLMTVGNVLCCSILPAFASAPLWIHVLGWHHKYTFQVEGWFFRSWEHPLGLCHFLHEIHVVRLFSVSCRLWYCYSTASIRQQKCELKFGNHVLNSAMTIPSRRLRAGATLGHKTTYMSWDFIQ